MKNGSPLIQIRNMTIGHGRPLYKDISFDISEGDCIMLCGANGSGKTTLLNAISEMQRKNDSVRRGTAETAMIPARVPKVKGFTLKEFIRLSCFTGTGYMNNGRNGNGTEKAMKILGIERLADRDISTLSDGEFQKACIAAALARRASVILLDEPTAFLDAENRRSVLQALSSLCSSGQGHAVIFSTHDLHEGMAACNKVLALGADGIFRCAPADEENVSIPAMRESMEKAVAGIFKETF